jgi:DNA-binding NarL/FixJ family response regulator
VTITAGAPERRAAGKQRRARVSVVADEPLLGDALCALLGSVAWIDPARARSIGDGVQALAGADDPRLIVAFVAMAGEVLFDTLGRVRREQPGVGVCLIAERVDPTSLRRVVSEAPGSFALLERSSMPSRGDLLVALQALVSGRVLLPPGELRAMVQEADARAGAWALLSGDEEAVADLVAEGLRNRDIGDRLGRSEKAIEHVVGRLYEKLGIDGGRDRRVLLARQALTRPRNGDRNGRPAPL